MPINFPASPANNQVYSDTLSGNRYVYDGVNRFWRYSSSGTLANTLNGQILFNNNTTFGGSNGAIYNSTSNTLFLNNVSVQGLNVTSNVMNFGTAGSIDPRGNLLIGRATSTVGAGVKVDVFGAINCSNILVNGGSVGASVFDDTVNATRYVVFIDSTTGTLTRANVDTALAYNPSTGTLSSTLFNSTSDINKKKDIVKIRDPLSLVHQIRGVRFKWKNNDEPSLGVIAQEIEKILPELVDDGKSVNYNGIIAVLIEAIKELQIEVEQLKLNTKE